MWLPTLGYWFTEFICNISTWFNERKSHCYRVLSSSIISSLFSLSDATSFQFSDDQHDHNSETPDRPGWFQTDVLPAAATSLQFNSIWCQKANKIIFLTIAHYNWTLLTYIEWMATLYRCVILCVQNDLVPQDFAGTWSHVWGLFYRAIDVSRREGN